MAGIKDIAKLAGVSIGTVDRVLHNRGRCADETRQRVLEAMKLLKYTPNLTARSLKRNETCRIALLQPQDNQDNGFWRMAREGALKANREFAPFNVEIVHYPFDRYREADFRRACREAEDCRGVLLAPVLPGPARNFCDSVPHLPVVTFDSSLSGTREIQALFQEGEIAGQTAAQLVALGCPASAKAAVIAYESENPNIELRVKGFCSRIVEYGFGDPDRFYFSEDIGYSELAGYLERNSVSLSHYNALFIAKTGTYKYARLLDDIKHEAFIVGMDLIAENIELLKTGSIDVLISQNTATQIFMGIKTLVNRIIYDLSPEKSVVHMPCDILTSSSIDTYMQFYDFLSAVNAPEPSV